MMWSRGAWERSAGEPIGRTAVYILSIQAQWPQSFAPSREVHLATSRRGFLKSLSRTAMVLSLDDVLGLAAPSLGAQQPEEKPKGSARQSYEAEARPAPKGAYSPVMGTPLGVQFVDVAREAGLR